MDAFETYICLSLYLFLSWCVVIIFTLDNEWKYYEKEKEEGGFLVFIGWIWGLSHFLVKFPCSPEMRGEGQLKNFEFRLILIVLKEMSYFKGVECWYCLVVTWEHFPMDIFSFIFLKLSSFFTCYYLQMKKISQKQKWDICWCCFTS